ncbi:MAG: zinc carboxypeptidase [Candidatus Sericytochromatia bacterium]|nr:zinc carboxypeptidase [Candidatus Tanganyikabacteria bacterium]
MKRLAGGLVALSFLTACSAAPWARLAGAAAGGAGARSEAGTQVTLAYKDRATLQRIADSAVDLEVVDTERRVARARVTRAQTAWLGTLGVSVQPDPQPVRLEAFDPSYHTYETLVRDMRALADAHPDICTLVDLGPTWETTKGKADRRVWGLHVKKGDASARPALAFIANQHSREIVTPEIALLLARKLVEGYGTDPEYTTFVDSRDIWIVPMVNPDGHARVVKGEDWRKNTDSDPVPGFGNVAAYGLGTDLNRNFPFHWGEKGASNDPENPTFRGRGPGSEPETQAISKLLQSRKFTFLMSYHSYSNLIMWPWGYSDAPPPDPRLPAIGKKLGALTGYRPQQSKDLYLTSGGITDFAFGQLGALAFTTEIGSWNDGFLPPHSRVAQFWKENEPAARYLLKTAAQPGQDL